MSATPSPEAAPPTPAVERPKKQAAVPDERLLDSPTRPTLIMLGAISLATLIMWGAGRAACNYHVPGESLTPRTVSLEERTANPKDLAIEFGQSIASGDFDITRQLVAEEAVAFVASESASCPGPCDQRKAERAALTTLADLVAFNPTDSYLRVRSFTPAGTRFERLVEAKRQGTIWKIVRVLDAKSPVPDLVPMVSEPPPGLRPIAPPPGAVAH